MDGVWSVRGSVGLRGEVTLRVRVMGAVQCVLQTVSMLNRKVFALRGVQGGMCKDVRGMCKDV